MKQPAIGHRGLHLALDFVYPTVPHQACSPEAVACVLRDWEALLAFYVVPECDWRRVRTTNAIERAFREVRRRTRPMTCFTNPASCDRIIYAVMHYLNSQWQGPLWRPEITQNS
ncbi:MAG: transposase [bacterium]